MKKASLTLLITVSIVQASQAELVPNGDFQMYKPGTNYTVTATFAGGNSYAPGVGDGIKLAGGSVTYSDGSPAGVSGDDIPDIDLPGWAPLQSGNDLFGNGVDGSNGMNLFASWGGDGRIQSAAPLGIIESGTVYTIKVMVGGPDSGPVQGPLAFHLAADGVQMTPSEFVDPTLPNGDAFQEISRTYDTNSTAGHIGAEMTIILGVEDANDFGNRVVFDNVSLEVLVVGPPPRFTLIITPNGDHPGSYDFTWDSRDNYRYDLVSSLDLTTAPATWPVWEGQAGLVGTAPENTLSNIPGGGAQRFFAMLEKAPPPLLSEDFEASAGGFTMVDHSGGVGTVWAWGDPDSDAGGGSVTTGAGNPPSLKCWGTNLGNPGVYTAGTDTSLISPVINLTGVAGATLSFAQAIDILSPGALVVNLIAADISGNITTIGSPLHVANDTGTTEDADWKRISGLNLAAGVGQEVRIEWRFTGNGDGNYIGAYIDDVLVGQGTP